MGASPAFFFIPFQETTHVKIPAVRAPPRRETLSPLQAYLWAFSSRNAHSSPGNAKYDVFLRSCPIVLADIGRQATLSASLAFDRTFLPCRGFSAFRQSAVSGKLQTLTSRRTTSPWQTKSQMHP